MARPLVLAAWLILAHVGVAHADRPAKTSKVTIETEPAGAKVYFGLKEDGEVCTTPCTVDAPIGTTAVIIEAENQRSLFENLVVRRSNRPMRVHFKLEPAIGTLIVEGGNGATIKLDEQDAGKAPRRIENVSAGGHHVALIKNGKQIFNDFVDVEAGQEATISAPSAVADAASRGSDDAAEVSAGVTAPSSGGTRATPMIAVSAAMSVGFRQFTYRNNQTENTQRDDREVGQLLTGAIVDVWPTTLFGVRKLPGLSLHTRFEYGVTPQAVSIKSPQSPMATETSLKTAWRSLEISLLHRWRVANAGAIEVGAGYIDDRYRFDGKADEVDVVPDASYQAVRIGGRGSLLLGSLEPYAAIENRIVLSGGVMEKRYTLGTSVFGVRGALGAVMHVGHFDVRLEGAITLYRWAFRYYASDLLRADGGSDVIENVTLAVGYWY
jgi:PEGA domain